MTLTLPEALMLFALRDDRGTVHSAAFLALDPALRGAMLAELSLRGHLQIKSDGTVRRSAQEPPSHPLLREGDELLASPPLPGSVEQHLERLANRMVDLRVRVVAVLEQRGILVGSGDSEREMTFLGDDHTEQLAQQRLVESLDQGDAIPPREGILTALTVACHLSAVVFGARAGEAERRAKLVAERSAIVRAVNANIAEIEGAW